MEPALIYVLFCGLVAFLGRNRKPGFWGYLCFSLLLTPIGGLIVLVASAPKDTRKAETSLPDAALASTDEGYEKTAKSYMERIDRLVASHRITRDFASRELLPLLVRDARVTARSGTVAQGGCSLDTILGALEALPMPAAVPVQRGPAAE